MATWTFFRLTAFFALLLPFSLHAAVKPLSTASPGSVPAGVSYQGRLSLSGSPVTASETMVFRVYDALTGGNLLWSSGDQTVSVSQGLFTASLTISTAALSGGGARYLEVTVAGEVLSPREALGSVPYALVAKSVEGAIDISGGGLSISSAPSSVPALFVSSQTGFVGIGTTSPQSALDVRGVIGGGGASGIFVTAAGNVGIGTTSPSSPLTVSGSVEIVGGGNGVVFPDGSLMTSQGLGSVSAVSNIGDAIITAGTGGSGDVVLKTGANERLRATYGGGVGIGTSSPGSKLHVSSGAMIIDGAGAGLQVGTSDLTVSGGLVGIGTSQPRAVLDVNGAAQFGSGAFKSTFTAAGDLQLVSGSTVAFNGTLSISTAPSAQTTAVPAVFIDAQARVGLGTVSPQATLDVNGSASFGSGAFKSTFTASGDLQLVSGSTIAAAGTLTLSTSPAAGTTAVPALFISTLGYIGIGTANPGAPLEIVTSSAKAIRLRQTVSVQGSVDLFVMVGDNITALNGNSLCATASADAACLGFWDSTGANLTCGGGTAISGRALCAKEGD